MGYLHISNLYRPDAQQILLFKEVFAMEKIHGTSSHLTWNSGTLTYSSGGEKHERFVSLFDDASLRQRFAAFGYDRMTVYGEAYGGSQQKQAWRYGPALRFVAFEVQVDDNWLAVPQAHDVCTKLGLEFVHYVKVATDLAALDAERDAPSEQARRNGVEGIQPREGVVLRPLFEVTTNNGSRLIAKHKRDDERETATPRKVVDPSQMVVLREAQAIADEWVTPTRLLHVLDKVGPDSGMEKTREVIAAMLADVQREASGEIVESSAARNAICKKTAELFKAHLKVKLAEAAS